MSESIKDKVAIVGMGCSVFGERWDCSSSDLVVEAATEAFEDAGIEPKDVNAAWVGTTAPGPDIQISSTSASGFYSISRLNTLPIPKGRPFGPNTPVNA